VRVVIAGGHGKIAQILERLLAERGDVAVGLVRNPAHRDDLDAVGAETVVVDLEGTTVDEVAGHVAGADAVVFAAGAGPGSGAARKQTVDHDAAVLLADAAETAGVRRYVMISSRGADGRAEAYEESNPVFAAYLRAKEAADAQVRARPALDATIVRPGRLTDEPAAGRVHVASDTGAGSVPRADVAAVVLAVLDEPATAGATFEVIGGDTPIVEAVARLTSR
jgi:uncharacterized protein YbjT (DUF2867 family)